MTMKFDEHAVRDALTSAWSLETASQWTADNPALGQCNVTAVLIHDLFGGEILRTWLPNVWHYYNRLDGRRMDLSDSQFSAPGALFAAPDPYQDLLTSREAAMSGIPQREYDALRAASQSAL